jgi:hypothetical protein
MGTIEDRKKLESQRSEILRRADLHDGEANDAREKLAAIKKQRESPEHLEKCFARDPAAVRLDEKLASEQAQLERDVSSRSGLAAKMRGDLSVTRQQIEELKFRELVETSLEANTSCRAVSVEAKKVIADLVPVVAKLRTHVAGLRAKMEVLPDDDRRKIQRFIDEISKFPGMLLLGELGTIFADSGMPLPLPESALNVDVTRRLDDLRAALQTLWITRTGDAARYGRKMYRAVSNVSGGLGTLTLQPGDLIALDPADEMTKKLLATGAITVVEGETKSLGSAA